MHKLGRNAIISCPLLVASLMVHATTLLAQYSGPPPGDSTIHAYPNFSFTYTDSNHDGLLELSELNYFQSTNLYLSHDVLSQTSVVWVPDISGVSMAIGTIPANCEVANWCMDGSFFSLGYGPYPALSQVWQLDDFTYYVDGVLAVPEPSTWALSLTGLLAVRRVARRKLNHC